MISCIHKKVKQKPFSPPVPPPFLQHRRKLEEEKEGGGGALHRLSNFSLSPFPFLHPPFQHTLLSPLPPFYSKFHSGLSIFPENPTLSPPFFGVTNKKKEREIWEKRCRLRLKRGKERRHSQERKKGGRNTKGKDENFLTFSFPSSSLSAAWYWIYQLSKNSILEHP